MAVAVLPDGRVVSGGGEGDGRVLLWDPARADSGPIELGYHSGWVGAVAVLPDGRVVSGGEDGVVLLWDPSEPMLTDRVYPGGIDRRSGQWRRWRMEGGKRRRG